MHRYMYSINHFICSVAALVHFNDLCQTTGADICSDVRIKLNIICKVHEIRIYLNEVVTMASL